MRTLLAAIRIRLFGYRYYVGYSPRGIVGVHINKAPWKGSDVTLLRDENNIIHLYINGAEVPRGPNVL